MRDFWARQKALFSEEDQARLRQSAFLVAGVGGLGCVVAEALARFGVGTLYLVDPARIDPPDLNRQILFVQKDLGRLKVRVAAERLGQIFPHLRIHVLAKSITADFSLPKDIVGAVDALDQWTSRFILNDLCAAREIFLVHAGLKGLFGQVTTVWPGKTPSLRDIFQGATDESHPPATVSTCLVLGALQALEAVKVFLGWEDNLLGRLLLVDLRDYSFEILSLA